MRTCPHLLTCACVRLQDPLEFPAHELRKYFRMGDHVKVIAGRYEGDTGLIVRVEENFVILFSDLTMHEVAFGIRCRLCLDEYILHCCTTSLFFRMKFWVMATSWKGKKR